VLDLADTLPIFKGITELEKTSISNRSTKMFTLSSIYQATAELLGKKRKIKKVTPDESTIAQEFWIEVTTNIPEWEQLIKQTVLSSELRTEFVHAHGLALHALGIAGHALIKAYPHDWKEQLKMLQLINWSRSNEQIWEGRAMNTGRISKAQMNLTLTTNYLKQIMKIPLTAEETRVEKRYLKQNPEHAL
jgi:DNA sulfur modification protein DndB